MRQTWQTCAPPVAHPPAMRQCLQLCLCSHSEKWKAPFSVFQSDFRGREKAARLKGPTEGTTAQSASSPHGGSLAHPVAVLSQCGRCTRKEAGVPSRTAQGSSSHTPVPTHHHCQLGLRALGDLLPFGHDSDPLRGGCVHSVPCPGQVMAPESCRHTGRLRGGLLSFRLWGLGPWVKRASTVS